MKASIGISGVTGVFRELSEPEINQYQSLKGYRFKGRGTVAVVFVYNGKEVLLVHSSKGDSWGFVQGGIEEETDVNLLGATRREVAEEVGFTQTLLQPNILLGEFLNKTPADSRCSYKHIFMLGIPVYRKDWVTLNDENDSYIWVDSAREFRSRIAEREDSRPTKHRAMLDAVDVLYTCRMLTWSAQL